MMSPRSLARATLALGVVALLSLAGCGGDDNDQQSAGSGGTESTATKSSIPDGPIVIGHAIAKSGFLVPWDGPTANAAKMAVDDINAKGGVLGHQLKLVSADTRSDRARGGAAAQAVLDQNANVVVVTCDFDFGSPAAIVAAQKGKVAFSTCAASPKFDVPTLGPLAFSMGSSTINQGKTLAQWAYNDKQFKRALVMLDDSLEYTRNLCSEFTKEFKALGGTVAGQETFKNGDTSVGPQVTRLKSKQASADAIMFCSYPPGGPTALKAMRAGGVTLPIMSGEAMDGNYWLKAVPDLSDFYYTAYGSIFGDDPSQEVNDFVDRYAKEYGEMPALANAMTGYALVQSVASAIEKAKSTDGKAVADALGTLGDFQTLIGPTTFSPENHISHTRPMRIMEIQGGKSKYATTYSPKGEVG